MLDEDFARIRAHRNNIHRYRSLLKTRLSDLERQFIERRLSEESSALEVLTSKTFPMHSRYPHNRRRRPRGRIVIAVTDLPFRGSEKVIANYRLLLASAKTERERELYCSRIEREQRLLDQLRDGFPERFAA